MRLGGSSICLTSWVGIYTPTWWVLSRTLSLSNLQRNMHIHANTDHYTYRFINTMTEETSHTKIIKTNHCNREKWVSFKARLDTSCPYSYSVSLHPGTWKDQKDKTVRIKGRERKQACSLSGGTTKSATGPGWAQMQH